MGGQPARAAHARDRAPLLSRRARDGRAGIHKKGATVPRHVHVAEQITFIIDGALRLVLGADGDEIHEVRAGEVLIIPSNEPHSATALEDTYDLDIFSPPREDWIKGQDAYLRGR